jgi:fluoride ion exporter CrcB/FEX
MRMFRTVALCGGLTTFSMFSLDGYYLIERGQALASFAYMVTHLLSPAKIWHGRLFLILHSPLESD